MGHDNSVSPVGWYYGSYLLRFIELSDKDRNDLEKRFTSWENTVIVEASSLENAYVKVEKIGRAASKPYLAGPEGVHAQWEYLGITELLPIYEKPADGAEIAWTDRAPRKLRKLKSYVLSRSSIGKKLKPAGP